MGIKQVSLLLLLSSCTMGPDFKAPDIPAPSSWFRAPVPAEPAQPIEKPVEAKWWGVLQDPLLDKLIAQLAKENLDVQAATERVEESRAQRGIAAADLYPQVNGDASYTREKLSNKGVVSLIGGSGGNNAAAAQSPPNGFPSSSPTAPFNIYQYGFDASWEIDLWGRVRRSVEAADANVQASEEMRHGTEISAAAELVRDYVALRGTQAQLSIARDSLKASEQIAALVENLAQSGLSNKLDVANAKAQAATTGSQIPPLEQQQDQLMNAIALLLGQPPGALEAELGTTESMPLMPPKVPIGIPSELAQRRPDIRQAEVELHAATAQIGVAKASFFPQVTLSGNGMLQALDFKGLNTWAARTYMFGPSIQLPIFEGGRLVSTLNLRTAQEREAATQYRKTLLNAFHEVDNALTALRNEQERELALEIAVKQNQQALVLATDRYKKGLATFLDVLTAERSLLDSRQQATLSKQTTLTDMVQLYKALGGGWEV